MEKNLGDRANIEPLKGRGRFLNTFMRLVLYVFRKLTMIVVIVVLVMFAAFMGYDYANIYVTVNEGITQRAHVILQEGDYTTLSKFYTQEYLEKDSMISNNHYRSFIVTSYDLRVKVKKISVWPWNDEAKVIVEEVIKEINAFPKDSEESSVTVPGWENAEKQIILKKNGRWRIDSVTSIKAIENGENTKNNES